jgi:hypothetical protein
MFQLSRSLGCFLLLICASVAAQECNDNLQPATPNSRFTELNNGTVIDTNTGLMWKQCAEGQSFAIASNTCTGAPRQFVPNEALALIDEFNVEGYAGFNDWRVPNIKELGSIIETKCVDPAINLSMFPNNGSGDYWSSTSWVGSPNVYFSLFCVRFVNGAVDRYCGSFGGGGMGGMGGGIPEASLRLVRDN